MRRGERRRDGGRNAAQSVGRREGGRDGCRPAARRLNWAVARLLGSSRRARRVMLVFSFRSLLNLMKCHRTGVSALFNPIMLSSIFTKC